MLKLDLDKLPVYHHCGERQFFENEKHVNRYCAESVLILMRKGVLRFSEDGKEIELFPGEYYIQRTGLWQQGLKPCDLPNYFYIHFYGNFDENGQLPIKGNFNLDEVNDYIDKLLRLPPEEKGVEPTGLFYNILSKLACSRKKPSSAEKVRNYIIENYDKPITLSELATLLFLSKNQTINIFKNAFGKTPYRYLSDLRLEKACELIISSNRPISEICYSVGFSDYSVFYKAFEKKYSVSPADYRALKTKSLDLSGKIITK